MNKRELGADLLLLLTAAVWGFGFVAQRSGMQYIGPFAYNAIRFLLGSLSLLPLIVWRKRRLRGGEISSGEGPSSSAPKSGAKRTFLASLAAGSCLFVAVSLQQLGMIATTAGNAGFITGLYVVFTPVFGIFLGKKTGKTTWAAAALTFIGLYFLSTSGGAGDGASGEFKRLNPGDLIIAVSAVFWTFHVLIIDRLVQKNDPLVLSSGQFAVAAFYAFIAAFFAEPFLAARLAELELAPGSLFSWLSFPALISGLSSGELPLSFVSNALLPILYGGLGSVGIGYTLQTVAQQYAAPAHATIILCLEGSFAALGGILLLHEPLGVRIIFGFALMLSGMILSQMEPIRTNVKNLSLNNHGDTEE